MKRTFQKISLFFLVSVYLICSLGFGIHECSASGSRNLILPFEKYNGKSLLNSKKIDCKCCCTKSCHERAHHSKKCCHTNFYYLERNYDVKAKLQTQEIYPELIAYLEISDSFNGLLNIDNHSDWALVGSPPPLLGNNTYSFHSQWRL